MAHKLQLSKAASRKQSADCCRPAEFGRAVHPAIWQPRSLSLTGRGHRHSGRAQGLHPQRCGPRFSPAAPAPGAPPEPASLLRPPPVPASPGRRPGPARTPHGPGLTLPTPGPTLGADWAGPRARGAPAPGPSAGTLAAQRTEAGRRSSAGLHAARRPTGRGGPGPGPGAGRPDGPGTGAGGARHAGKRSSTRRPSAPSARPVRAGGLHFPGVRAQPPADYTSQGAARERRRTTLPRGPRARSPAPPCPAPGASGSRRKEVTVET